MFGYVTADLCSLGSEQQLLYRSYYCGLCRCIGKEYGMLTRLSLNYDLTFLAILLSSLYEPEETTGSGRCIAHPLKQNAYRVSEAICYAAAMNLALVYHKCRDDWQDERKFPAHLYASVLKRSVSTIAMQYPRQWQAIETCINKLSQLEKDGCQEPDYGAALFGKLMEELFIWKEDRWSEQLRKMGNSLGQFIYLMDAILDLPEDQKAGRYNPFSSRSNIDLRSTYYPVLQILMGECTDAFEQLPLVENLKLLRNILYSGIWLRWKQIDTKEPDHV